MGKQSTASALATGGDESSLPLVPGPALAMERMPGPSWLSTKFSSANFPPYMLSPPVPKSLQITSYLGCCSIAYWLLEFQNPKASGTYKASNVADA
jgi:hypothetical protein